MIGWIDSHAHIFDETYFSPLDVIARAKNAGISKIMAVCCTLEEAKRAIKIAAIEPILDIAIGFHPSDIHEITEEMWNNLEILAHNPYVIAIGEIGLDAYWNPETLPLQEIAFVRQIKLANKVKKPILVHSRDAITKTLSILKKHPVEAKGILHCFSSSVEMAIEFIKLGYLISLGGPVTFKNAKTPKEVAAMIGLENLLIETDSPYLTPHPFRGKTNEPAYLIYTAQEICQIKEIDEETLKEAQHINYMRLFHSEN